MRRFAVFLITAWLLGISVGVAHADWRWSKPNYHLGTLKVGCSSEKCYHDAKVRRAQRLKTRVYHYNLRKRKEWNYWSRLYIPACTWYGESGRGPQFAPYRYTLPNSLGSGAYGKYQMMPGTYSSRARYGDWSPLDQEIAGHREFWAHGTSPWANC